MKRIVWIFVNGLFFASATNKTTAELDNTNNSVKIALGAALGLNNTNNTENIQLLDKVQKVIGKMKTVIEHKSNKRRNYGGIIHKTFTDFIQDLINKLNQFNDSDLEIFLRVFADEITKYHYRGCKFYEITDNHNFRSLFSNLLHEIEVQPLNKIKRVLKIVANKLEKKSYDKHEKDLIDTINSLYRHDSTEKLDTFLVNIDAFRMKTRKNIDLVNIVRDGLKTNIFDHYTNLNPNARKALRVQMNEYFKEFSPQSTTKFIDSIKYSKLQKLSLTTKKSTKNTVREGNKFYKKDLRPERSENARNGLKKNTKSSLYLIDEHDTNKSSNEHIERANAATRKDLQVKRIIARNSFNKTTDSRHIPIKPLRTTQRFNTEINPHIKYETDAFEYMMIENKRKKFTYRTLYPKFVHEVTESKPLTVRRAIHQSIPEYSWEEDEINTSIQRPRQDRAIHLAKELCGTVKIGMKSSPLRRMDSKLHKAITTAENSPYSWEEDNINSSIEKARRLKAKRLTKKEATSKIEMKEKQAMRRLNSNCPNSKRKVENYHESLLNSIRRSIADVKSLERKVRLNGPLKSNLTKGINRRRNKKLEASSKRRKTHSSGNKFKIYSRRNDINTSDFNIYLPITNNLTNVQVISVSKAINLQTNNGTTPDGLKNKTTYERIDVHNKISHSIEKNNTEVKPSYLEHDYKAKDSTKENLKVPKNTEVGEEIKYIKDENEHKSTPEINKHPLNVTNVEVNKGKILDSISNIQRDKNLTPKPNRNANAKGDAPSKFEHNNSKGEYNYNIPIEAGTTIIDSINNVDLSKQKTDIYNLKNVVDPKSEMKTDPVEIPTNYNEQAANYDENYEEKDLEPWVPNRENDLKEEIEDYENNFAKHYNVEQGQDKFVFRAVDTTPRSVNKNSGLKTDHIAAITTNKTASNTIISTITPKQNFADVPSFVYVDNDVFGNIDKLTTKQSYLQKSQVTQNMKNNFPINDSMEKIRREVINSGEINFSKDMHYGSDRENGKKEDITDDVFPEVAPALGRIAARI